MHLRGKGERARAHRCSLTLNLRRPEDTTRTGDVSGGTRYWQRSRREALETRRDSPSIVSPAFAASGSELRKRNGEVSEEDASANVEKERLELTKADDTAASGSCLHSAQSRAHC